MEPFIMFDYFRDEVCNYLVIAIINVWISYIYFLQRNVIINY